MTVTTERRVTHHELLSVVIACLSCRAELSLDLAHETLATRLRDHTRHPPLQCALCAAFFDSSILRALTAALALHEALRGTPAVLTFRIPEPPPAT